MSIDQNSPESDEHGCSEVLPGFLDKLLGKVPADARGLVYECLGGKKCTLLSSVNKTWRAEIESATISWKRMLDQELDIKANIGSSDSLLKLFGEEYRYSNCTHLNQEMSVTARLPVEAVTSELMNDRYFLVIGGFSYHSQGGTPVVQIYDLQNNWHNLVRCMNASRYGHTSSHIGDGKILLLGGFPWGGYVGLAPPAMIQWTERSRQIRDIDFQPTQLLLDFDLCYHTADRIKTDEGDFVVTFGGTRDQGACNDVFVYNIETGSFEEKSFPEDDPLPSPRAGHCSAVIGGDQLYIFGGVMSDSSYVRTGSLCSDDPVWKLDCSKWKWTRISDVPSEVIPYMGGQAVHLNGKEILLLGGNYDHDDPWTASRFNLETKKATRLDSDEVRFFRDTHTVQKWGKRVIVHGGSETRQSINRGGPCPHVVIRPDILRMTESEI